MADDYGYGDVGEVVRKTSAGGKYLKLENNSKHYLRIASRPRYTIKHWENRKPLPHTDENCAYCKSTDKDVRKKVAQWYWIVIDRGINYPVKEGEPETEDTVKIFQAPNSVAMRIRDLSELISPKTKQRVWGDPTTFDIIIEKMVEGDAPPKYSVDGDVETKNTPLTPEEKQLVTTANFDLDLEIEGGQKSEHVGNYGEGKANMETLPTEEVNPADIPDDLGEVGKSAEDDIPF